MDEYTPTTEEIREYVEVGDTKLWESPSPEVDARERRRGAAFDRWITEHDRLTAERAWDEGFQRGSSANGVDVNDDGSCGTPELSPYRGD